MKNILTASALALSFLNPVQAEETKCLARAIWHEARGEPIEGQKAVAQVVLNRAKHPEFPNSICQVINQPGQFPWASKNFTRYQAESFKEALQLAKRMKAGEAGPVLTSNALFFNGVPFSYSRLKYVGKIGGHLFYDLKPRKKSRKDV